MKKPCAALLVLIGSLLAIAGHGEAETRTISWASVTTYTDGTPIEATKTVTYEIFWTTDPGLSPASLKTVASSVPQTSATFDPDALGMPRGQTVYFTGDAVLNTGEKSALASAYAWGATTLATPQNVAVIGPVTTTPAKQFQLKWDPVTRHTDGTPIPSGSVRYEAYWSTDPGNAAGTWKTLASSTSATSVNFDPNAVGMPKSQRVYFTAQAKDTLGEQSPLAPAVSWVASNQGPAAPANGKVLKK